MSRFLVHLNLELMWDANGRPLASHGGRQLYQLTNDFFYQSDVADQIIRVPRGFVTDLASIPRIPLVYDALGDRIQQEAVIHDYLYSTGSVSREMADNVLLEAMELNGVPSWQRYPIYWGVRVGGGSHFATT